MKNSSIPTSVIALTMLAGSAVAQCGNPLNSIQANDPAASDMFGKTISMHAGTGSPVVAMIGSPDKDISGFFSAGKVYSYGKSGVQWGYLTSVQALDPQTSGLFGSAIASTSAVMLVGAPGCETYDGAVYVFRRPGVDWEQIQKIPARIANSEFGTSVAFSGNNGAIGAPAATVLVDGATVTKAGRVHLYARNTTTGLWSWSQDIVDPQTAAINDFDNFGAAVEYVGTGYLAVGIPGRDITQGATTRVNVGAVNLYMNTAQGWVLGSTFNAPSPNSFAAFGQNIKMTSDWMAVSAASDASVASQCGAVYMYKRTGTTWNLVERLDPSPATAGALFGSHIDMDGDLLVVGTSNEDKAYVFRRNGDHWVQERRFDKPSTAVGMGDAIAIYGTDFIVTNTQQTVSGQTLAGEAYAFTVGAPQSDVCADAQQVGFGTFYACTDAASPDAPGAAPCVTVGNMNAPDVWWSFTAPAAGMIEISTEGSSFDTVLSVHTGCPATANNAIACNDDIASGVLHSRLTMAVASGQNIKIRGSGYNGAAGSMTLKISAAASCYANCDASTATPILNALDFSCFLTKYAAGDGYANCDGSTATPILNALDFGCFLTKFAAGCN